MCMYSCEALDGVVTDWHLTHLGARAAGGCGLVMTEAAAVTPAGRISPQDLGVWSNDHVPGLARVVRFIKEQGSVAGIQLAHAGRKAGTYRPWSETRGFIPDHDGGWERFAPSAIAFRDDAPVPTPLTVEQIDKTIQCFVEAVVRSLEAGFEVIELHAAHGYLLHQFLSPLSNHRSDGYGGGFQGRTKLLRELVTAVRKVMPETAPLFVRNSSTDWVEGGWTIDDTVRLATELEPLGVDLMDCSSGGTVFDAEVPVGPGYQVQFAQRVKNETGVMSAAVGMLTQPAQCEQILSNGDADLVLIGREMLRDPNWAIHAAIALGEPPAYPAQYGWAVG